MTMIKIVDMTIFMGMIMHAMTVIVIAIIMLLRGCHPITFKQANAQQQRQGHLTFDAAKDASF